MSAKKKSRAPSLDNLAAEAGKLLLEEVGDLFTALFASGQASVPSSEPAPGESPASVLGVADRAPREVVDAAYRVQAAAAHPDRAGGDAEWFKKLTGARDTLYKERGWK
jgi:hypothetical protein